MTPKERQEHKALNSRYWNNEPMTEAEYLRLAVLQEMVNNYQQNYEEYLETMHAYIFNPMDYQTWAYWKVYHHKEKARIVPLLSAA